MNLFMSHEVDYMKNQKYWRLSVELQRKYTFDFKSNDLIRKNARGLGFFVVQPYMGPDGKLLWNL